MMLIYRFSASLMLFALCTGVVNRRDCALDLPLTSATPSSCITFSDVNNAFEKARRLTGLHQTPREVTPFSLDLVGSTIQETTRIIADKFRLSRTEVLELTRLDTLRTNIGDVCPRHLRSDVPQPCRVSRYRRYDGVCNNLNYPEWGSTRHPFNRLLPPDYADGVSVPRASRTGFPLPNARRLSSLVHASRDPRPTSGVTLLFVAWGQLIDHDLTQTAETKDQLRRTDLDCCGADSGHPNCLALTLPAEDRFYRRHGQKCMSVTRSLAAVRQNCHLGPRVQLNEVSSYIDAGFVYGSNIKTADSLRTLESGKLRMLPAFKRFGLKDLLPLKLNFPDEGCIRPNKDIYCFVSGDHRVNEQLILTVLHTTLAREHNRIANQLAKINSHWDDEKLYQESRHIIAAIVQHITYSEFLPLLLGLNTMQKYNLEVQKEGYSSNYDPTLDATVTSSFVTAAFRFGHSLLPNEIERWSISHKYIGAQRLSELLKQPFDLYKPGWFDQYVMGMVNELPQAMDKDVTDEVTNHLFQHPSHFFGMDLAAINVLRAREHGVPSYNAYRELCGLPQIERWSSMQFIMENKTIQNYFNLYDHPDDVDLWSAGIAELPIAGSMVGPTFNCLIAKTFYKLKHGDRFWYENKGWPSSFTPDQLAEIRKIRLARLLCDSGDSLESIQEYAMIPMNTQKNSRMSCNNKILPRLDLFKWKAQHEEYQLEPSIPTPVNKSDVKPTDMKSESTVRFPEETVK